MKYLLSIFLIICALSLSAQRTFTETDWTYIDTSYIEIVTVTEEATTWYLIYEHEVSSSGYHTRTALAPPMLEAQLINWANMYMDDSTSTLSGLSRESSIRAGKNTTLSDLLDSLE